MKYIMFFFLFLTGCFNGFHRTCLNTNNVSWKNLPAKITPTNLNPNEVVILQKAVTDWNTTLKKEYIKVTNDSTNYIMNGGTNFEYNQEALTHLDWFGIYLRSSNIYVNQDLAQYVDLESLYIHELGHFLGLKHIENTVMDPVLPNFTQRTNIDQIVIDSIQCLYEGR